MVDRRLWLAQVIAPGEVVAEFMKPAQRGFEIGLPVVVHHPAVQVIRRRSEMRIAHDLPLAERERAGLQKRCIGGRNGQAVARLDQAESLLDAIEIGQRFVDFNLQNQDDKPVTLDDFARKWLVVYVYPKDDTPGCTIQGKSFTATKQEFDEANIAVVGVSADDVESHKNFCNKFSFTIDLLADPNHELLNAAGVGQSEYKSTMYWNRTSFVIDPEGELRKIYEKVNPEGHERVLLDDIKAMQASG